jgi:hypothetical protein
LGKTPSGTGCVDGVVVVIEIDDDTNPDDLKNEIETNLGTQVTVVEISVGVFEVTVADSTDADQLVKIVGICRT